MSKFKIFCLLYLRVIADSASLLRTPWGRPGASGRRWRCSRGRRSRPTIIIIISIIIMISNIIINIIIISSSSSSSSSSEQ